MSAMQYRGNEPPRKSEWFRNNRVQNSALGIVTSASNLSVSINKDAIGS